jgi:RimJ/RimL family protein N-acetyltransferase
MSVPELETPRLLLRGHRPDDFASYAAMWADPQLTRHIGDGSVKSRADAWTSFLRHVGHWRMTGFGNWVVEEKASGRQIGTIGFNERRRENTPEFDGVPELGWMFVGWTSGNGYATEALGAALSWGREHFGPVRVIAIVAPDNLASLRVAEKNGFREFKRSPSAGRQRIFLDRML